MKFFLKMKIFIRKHIRKYIPALCSLFLIPLFSFNAFAYSATYPQYNYSLPNIGVRFLSSDGTYSAVGFPSRVDTVQDVYSINYSHISVMDEYLFYSNSASPNNATWVIPYLPDYDYYFLANYYFEDQTLDFNISDFKLCYSIDSTVYEHIISNVNIIPYSIDSRHGYTMMCKIDSFSTDAGLYSHRMYFDDEFSVINKLQFYTASVFVVPKGDTQALDNIAEAINNQTDIIENGTSDTQSAVDNFTSVFDDFNQELENWEQFDDEVIGEFDEANTGYMNELSNFSLSGSLLNAGNWLSTSMQTVYDNSSDYKMLWLVPLLFGIPILLFIIRKNGDDE